MSQQEPGKNLSFLFCVTKQNDVKKIKVLKACKTMEKKTK